MMAGSDLGEWAVIPSADSTEYSKRLAYEVGCPTSDNQRLVDCLRYSRSFSEIVNASARVRMMVRTVTTRFVHDWYEQLLRDSCMTGRRSLPCDRHGQCHCVCVCVTVTVFMCV